MNENEVIKTAAACGGLLQYNHQITRRERYDLPEGFWEDRLKHELKRTFGDFVVRNKITMEERTRPHGILEHRAELLVFTPEQLMTFLHRLGVRFPEELDNENHMGIPFC